LFTNSRYDEPGIIFAKPATRALEIAPECSITQLAKPLGGPARMARAAHP
jgi:hypothetical protein